MRWIAYVAVMGEKRNAYKYFMRKPEGKNAWKTSVNGRIILKCILWNRM
jgi:hypothetical protein